MKYKFLIISTAVIGAAFIFLKTTQSEKLEPGPACFASDTLRVEIGGKQFAFPRKIVRGMEGAGVVNFKDMESHSATGSKACQIPGSPPWQLETIGLDLNPKSCQTDEQCDLSVIYAFISDLNIRKTKGLKHKNIPTTEKSLLEKCHSPRNPYSDTHKKYWSFCDFAFEDEGLDIWIRFTGGGGVYPPEKIEDTKRLVLKSIYQYKASSN